jgi:hypothetical protein
MDHEQNASTSTVRTAGSSQANPFACVASGIAALWGPAHGGANEAVLRMLAVRGPLGRGGGGCALGGAWARSRGARDHAGGGTRPWLLPFPHPAAIPPPPHPAPTLPPPQKAIGTKDRIPEFVARAKDRNDPFRLMGFGHRVYKVGGHG